MGQGGTVRAEDDIFIYGKGNENHQLGRVFYFFFYIDTAE